MGTKEVSLRCKKLFVEKFFKRELLFFYTKRSLDYAICPECRMEDCIPLVAHENVKNYGGKILKVFCKHCKTPLRAVKIYDITIGTFKKGDF